MNDLTIAVAVVVTMTSLELVEYINSVRKEDALAAGVPFPSKGFAKLEHSDFMKKVPEVLGSCAGKFSGTYQVAGPKGGSRPAPLYTFPKREACLMAMSYSYELQAKVYDKMTALEQGQFQIPMTLSGALMMAAKQAEQIEYLQKQRAEDAPKVEFAMAVRRMEGACKIGDFGKVIGIGRNTLFDLMRQDQILMADNKPYQRYIDSGFFVVIENTPYTDRNGKAYPAFTTMVTGKGQVWLERKYRNSVKKVA